MVMLLFGKMWLGPEEEAPVNVPLMEKAVMGTHTHYLLGIGKGAHSPNTEQ